MRFPPFTLLMLLAHVARAQTPDPARRPVGATVSGIVRDSIARAPLSGAVVQLVAADTTQRFTRTSVADSLGRFTLDDVPSGRYTLGFFHPMLDSLGLAPMLREVRVENTRAVHADLAIPSAARLEMAICGKPPSAGLGGALIGVVRDARSGVEVADAVVESDWTDLSLVRGQFVPRPAHVAATTRKNGWFALCNVPSPGTITLIASRGIDSTDRIEVPVPAEGFLRRALYLGSVRTSVI